MNSGIYRIEIGPYFYWGSTCDFHVRKMHHLGRLNNNAHVNNKMQHVYNKYQDFEMELVVYSDKDDLFKIEQEFLDEDHGKQECMNLAKVAEASARGLKRTEETKAKMSAAQLALKKTISPENRKALSDLMTGAPGRRYDKTIYHFVHVDGREEKSNQRDFYKKHNLKQAMLQRVVSGKRKHHKGWSIK